MSSAAEGEEAILGNNPVLFVRTLESLDRRVSLLLRVLIRLEAIPLPMGFAFGEQAFVTHFSPRLAFFAGLIAAGIDFDMQPAQQQDHRPGGEDSSLDGMCGSSVGSRGSGLGEASEDY